MGEQGNEKEKEQRRILKAQVVAFVWGALIGILFSMFLIVNSAQASYQERDYIKRIVIYRSVQAAINPRLVLAIIQIESSFDANAKGKAGEVGLMQLHPRYFLNAPFDINTNIYLGIRFLVLMREKCEPRYGDAWFVCYNYGPYTSIRQPRKTQYYQKVMAILEPSQ